MPALVDQQIPRMQSGFSASPVKAHVGRQGNWKSGCTCKKYIDISVNA
jgi:hypothetical protein